ncbi:MAG: hypothetical protein O9284_18020 [Steroidobacteraceae bacterium]|nr:hypothetical protein [Steroidobacteraceae bacterium]
MRGSGNGRGPADEVRQQAGCSAGRGPAQAPGTRRDAASSPGARLGRTRLASAWFASAWLASAWLAVASFADTALAADAPAAVAPATAAANAAPAGTTRTPGLAAFGRLPALDNVALSPDGRRLAYVTAIGDERYLVVATIGEKPLSGAVRLGETKLREVEWIDSRHLLLTTSTTASVWGLVGPRREWFMAQVYDVESRKIRPLQPRGTSNETTMNVIVGPADVRTVEGRAMVFVRGIVVTDRTARAAPASSARATAATPRSRASRSSPKSIAARPRSRASRTSAAS